MNIKFQNIEPHFMLKKYISKMWLFESSGKLMTEDIRLIVPSGDLKLTISFKNGIVAAINGNSFSSKEQDITLTGLIDMPVYLDVEKDITTETIGVEFNPNSAYRFFHFTLNEIKNKIFSLSDVLGTRGNHLIEVMNNTSSVVQKTVVLQQFLLNQLTLQNDDPVFEYCIDNITTTKGKITIKELEKKTGYSSRWLNMKFNERLGVSPKNFASVIRFRQYYQSFINGSEKTFFKNDFYELYYDQSHFIKDFKRFTGLAPTQLERLNNHLGESYHSK